MDVEFVFTGICSFVNVRNDDVSVIGPSAILIKADDEAHHAAHQASAEHAHDGECRCPHHPNLPKPVDNNHIPFIGFDSRLVTLENDDFQVLEEAKDFKFLRLDAAEVRIHLHDPGIPILDSTFGNVASKELYWPESRGQWNHDVVPKRGSRPKKTAVKAFMRLGFGKLSGGRLCPYKWRFTKLNGDTFSRHFAEEVIYSYTETERESVVVKLFDLEDRENEKRKLIFRPAAGKTKVTLFIGNNILDDMDDCFRRKTGTESFGPGDHFHLFYSVVGPVDGRVPPLPVPIPPLKEDGTEGGGGTDGGICGPDT